VRDIPEQIQHSYQISCMGEVTFTQLSTVENSYEMRFGSIMAARSSCNGFKSGTKSSRVTAVYARRRAGSSPKYVSVPLRESRWQWL
jgi:hypothetical protein